MIKSFVISLCFLMCGIVGASADIASTQWVESRISSSDASGNADTIPTSPPPSGGNPGTDRVYIWFDDGV